MIKKLPLAFDFSGKKNKTVHKWKWFLWLRIKFAFRTPVRYGHGLPKMQDCRNLLRLFQFRYCTTVISRYNARTTVATSPEFTLVTTSVNVETATTTHPEPRPPRAALFPKSRLNHPARWKDLYRSPLALLAILLRRSQPTLVLPLLLPTHRQDSQAGAQRESERCFCSRNPRSNGDIIRSPAA